MTAALLVSVIFLLAVMEVSASTTSELWVRTYGGSSYDGFNQIINTSDGGYVLTGYTASFGNGTLNVWLVKMDSAGNVQWHRTYGGSAKSAGNSVVQTNDGGYAIAGYRISDEDGVRNIFMVRTDASGNELWNRTYMASEMGYAMSVAVLPDDSLVLAGVTYTYTGIAKARLIKTDANVMRSGIRPTAAPKKTRPIT